MSTECDDIYAGMMHAVKSGNISELENLIIPYGEIIKYHPVESVEVIDRSDMSRPMRPAYVCYGISPFEEAVVTEDTYMLDMMLERAPMSSDELMSLFEFTIRHEKIVALSFLLCMKGYPRHEFQADDYLLTRCKIPIDDRAKIILLNEYNHRGWYHDRWASLATGVLPTRRGALYPTSTSDITNKFMARIFEAMTRLEIQEISP